MFSIETKQAQEFGQDVTLYSAKFADGYQTVWYSNQLRAIAAGKRAAAKHGNPRRVCPACHNEQWREPHNCTDGPATDLAAEVVDALTPRGPLWQ